MKLSELVALRNKFLNSHKFKLQTHNSGIVEEIKKFITQIDHKGFMTSEQLTLDNIALLEKQFMSIDSAFDNTIKQINLIINERSKPFYNNELPLGELVRCGVENAEFIRKYRFPTFIPHIKDKVISRITMHSTPRHPTLQINPEDGYWTPYLVAADPLYIVDKDEEFIIQTKNRFSEIYQKRMRCYINGQDGAKLWDLSFLPQNQFSLVFAWNFFNFIQIDIIEKYLESIFNVLAPGGHAVFSFNNCDIPTNAAFAETGFKSWATETSIVNLCKQKGFDITLLNTEAESFNYIEITKPGVLTTVKTTQALGEIREIGS